MPIRLIAKQPNPSLPHDGRVGLGRTRRNRPCFPSPLHSFRTVGFPQYGWKTAFAKGEPSSTLEFAPLRLTLPRSDLVQGSGSPYRAIPLQSRWCVCVCRPTGPWLSAVYHARTCNRYYGLMRQSDGLRPVYGLSRSVFALTGCPPGFPFFALTHALRPCRSPYPADCPSSLDGSSLGHTSLHRLGFGSAVSANPLTGSRGVCITRQQVSLYVTACTLARAADQSPPAPLGTDRPARLQQSLPRLGSPPVRVCYHYSAHPPIAEAGLSPARLSKNEGCTTRPAPATYETRTSLIDFLLS